MLRGIESTVKRELSLTHLYVIEPFKSRFYDPKGPLFGPEFENGFKSSGFELDEAAKCFALGRPTAAVFHLMRLMEIAVGAVAKCLGVPDPTRPAERNWGHILGEIWKAIEAK